MSTSTHEFNRDNGLPTFNPPASMSEARNRIAELNSAIKSIDDQISVRELSDNLDAEWLKRSTTSQRFKTLERDRLLNWIEDRNYDMSNGKNIDRYIIAIVQNDYDEEEWNQITREAKEIMDLS